MPMVISQTAVPPGYAADATRATEGVRREQQDASRFYGDDKTYGPKRTENVFHAGGSIDATQYTRDELKELRAKYEAEYANKYPWRWDYALIALLVGGLVGTIISTFTAISEDECTGSGACDRGEVRQIATTRYSYGLVIGCAVGFLAAAGVMCVQTVYYHRNDPFAEHVRRLREVVRMREREEIEKHDEFVYYDAAQKHSCCFNFFCCPHYGKITSERVIYSDYGKGFLERWYKRKVETLDIEHMLDVSVEQSSLQYFKGLGNILLHIRGQGDASSIKDERDKVLHLLGRSVNELDKGQLRAYLVDVETQLYNCRGIRAMEPLVLKLENKRSPLLYKLKDLEEKAGQVFTDPMPRPRSTDASNTLHEVRVRDVKDPYVILDALSYQVSKGTQFKHGHLSKHDAISRAEEAANSQAGGGVMPRDIGEAIPTGTGDASMSAAALTSAIEMTSQSPRI